MSTECFFTKLITWKDPSLSAAFLTVGNAFVLLMLLSGDALSWLQFLVVYAVLPLGLVARLTGFDQSIRLTSSSSAKVRTYYESHCFSQLQGIGLVRLGVYLVVVAQLVAMFGVPLMVGIVGNTVMLVPLIWSQFGPLMMSQAKNIPIEAIAGQAKSAYVSGLDFVASFGPLAASALGGVSTFLAVILLGHMLSSEFVLVFTLRLVGYGLVLVFALAPAGIADKAVAAVVPSPERVESSTRSIKVADYSSQIRNIVLWENYGHSITGFVAVYCFYFVSSFTGVTFLLALGAGVFVCFYLAPTVYKEKVAGELDRMIALVKTKMPSLPAAKPVKPVDTDEMSDPVETVSPVGEREKAVSPGPESYKE